MFAMLNNKKKHSALELNSIACADWWNPWADFHFEYRQGFIYAVRNFEMPEFDVVWGK